MKRALIALAAVAFVAAAISVARANSGEDTPKAEPTSATNRDLVKQQTKAQAEEVMKAQADLAEKVAQDNRAQGQQTLVITIREESPGEVWVAGKVDGKPACVTPPKKDPTFVEVTADQDGPTLKSETAPLEAALLKNGACEAVLELFVPDTRRYRVTIGGAGKASFKPVDVQNADHPIKVTIVG
jgi:Ni/Co efflux regulator RcnB